MAPAMPLLRDSTPLAVASMLSAPPEITKPKPAAVRLWDVGLDDDVNLRGERVINLTRPLPRPPSSALQDAGASEEVAVSPNLAFGTRVHHTPGAADYRAAAASSAHQEAFTRPRDLLPLAGKRTGTLAGGETSEGNPAPKACDAMLQTGAARQGTEGNGPRQAHSDEVAAVQTPGPSLGSSLRGRTRHTEPRPSSTTGNEVATSPPPPGVMSAQDRARRWRLELDCAWSSIPHPLKVHRGGEDVHIMCRAGGATLIGVFDGVGGWSEVGVDPAEYARRLGHLIEVQLREDSRSASTHERPLLVWLQRAVGQLEQEDMPGSCTACLALLTNEGLLHVLNLGDSGLHLIRNGVSVFQTNEQQHYFNCPFQLGMGSDDSPLDADYYIIDDLRHGDLIVAGTDGVWDNVYEEELLQLVTDEQEVAKGRAGAGHGEVAAREEKEAVAAGNAMEVWPLEPLARSISRASHLRARDTEYASPFATNAHKEGLRYMGGKLDDITVVVSRLCRVPMSPRKPAGVGPRRSLAGKAKGTALHHSPRQNRVDAGPVGRAEEDECLTEWPPSIMSQEE